MKKLIIPVFCISLFGLTCCEKNQAPEISSIKSLTEVIVGGSEVLLVVNVSDENGEVLTYNWSANVGEFIYSTTSDSVIWKAPISITEESYTITVEVSDGELKVEDELIISVVGAKFIDLRDDNIYDFVQIGEQLWMAENLAYLPAVSDLFHESDVDRYYYVYGYNGNVVSEAKSTDNYSKYGVLYNFPGVSCPEGWHLPTDEEWKMLEKYLGMSSIEADTSGFRISGDVGRKLKSISGWAEEGNGDNSSGFNTLPGGYAFGGFDGLEGSATFWSSTAVYSHDFYPNWYRWLVDGLPERDQVYRGWAVRNCAFSVRCIKH